MRDVTPQQLRWDIVWKKYSVASVSVCIHGLVVARIFCFTDSLWGESVVVGIRHSSLDSPHKGPVMCSPDASLMLALTSMWRHCNDARIAFFLPVSVPASTCPLWMYPLCPSSLTPPTPAVCSSRAPNAVWDSSIPPLPSPSSTSTWRNPQHLFPTPTTKQTPGGRRWHVIIPRRGKAWQNDRNKPWNQHQSCGTGRRD